jgi:hypothetical protein
MVVRSALLSHQPEGFYFYNITRLQIELAMLTVHEHGVSVLTFTEPRHITDSCSPTFSGLAGSLHSANIAKICRSRKSSVIVGFDHVSGQPGIPPRALDVHRRANVAFQSSQPSALGPGAEVRPCTGERARVGRHLSVKGCRTSALTAGAASAPGRGWYGPGNPVLCAAIELTGLSRLNATPCDVTRSSPPIDSAKPVPRRDPKNTGSREQPYRCGTP